MTVSYDDALLCPRCGAQGTAKADDEDDAGQRLVIVYCEDKKCSQYGRTWFLMIDSLNRVQLHTHTPYRPATEERETPPDE